jgi:hypothetical protein
MNKPEKNYTPITLRSPMITDNVLRKYGVRCITLDLGPILLERLLSC